jgi:hypothetical protein
VLNSECLPIEITEEIATAPIKDFFFREPRRNNKEDRHRAETRAHEACFFASMPASRWYLIDFANGSISAPARGTNFM